MVHCTCPIAAAGFYRPVKEEISNFKFQIANEK